MVASKVDGVRYGDNIIVFYHSVILSQVEARGNLIIDMDMKAISVNNGNMLGGVGDTSLIIPMELLLVQKVYATMNKLKGKLPDDGSILVITIAGSSKSHMDDIIKKLLDEDGRHALSDMSVKLGFGIIESPIAKILQSFTSTSGIDHSKVVTPDPQYIKENKSKPKPMERSISKINDIKYGDNELQRWANEVAEKFYCPLYLVGSYLEGDGNHRDVDVLAVISDEHFKLRYGSVAEWKSQGKTGDWKKERLKWSEQCISIWEEGCKKTGENLDFKIIPRSVFDKNEKYQRLDTLVHFK